VETVQQSNSKHFWMMCKKIILCSLKVFILTWIRKWIWTRIRNYMKSRIRIWQWFFRIRHTVFCETKILKFANLFENWETSFENFRFLGLIWCNAMEISPIVREILLWFGYWKWNRCKHLMIFVIILLLPNLQIFQAGQIATPLIHS